MDGQTDRQTDRQTEIPSLYRDCIPCSAVIGMTKSILVLHTAHFVLYVFCCYGYVSILQSSTTRTVVINAFQIFYIFFRAVSDVQLPIMFIFKSSIARQRINIRHYVYCQTVLWTISCLVACMYQCRREFIARPILPTLSLHALFTLAVFTCRFHYPQNPYDVLYTLFPLPAQSIPPKWPLPAVSLHAH